MAIDEAEQAESGEFSDEAGAEADDSVVVGRYTWADFMEEHGHGGEVADLYPQGRPQPAETADVGLSSSDVEHRVPAGTDWDRVDFDPEAYLGFHPDDLAEQITEVAGPNAKWLQSHFDQFLDLETTPVVKDEYTWAHFEREFPDLDIEDLLGFGPEESREHVEDVASIGNAVADIVDERTVDVREEVEEDDFFTDQFGNTTVVNRYDLEKAVPMEKKRHFQEEDRYWVNKPYAFVILFHSRKENEKKYYAVEPHLNEIESDLREFLVGKLRTAIKYADDDVAAGADSTEDERRAVIERETKRLLRRYDLLEGMASAGDGDDGFLSGVLAMLGKDEEAGLPEASEEAEGDPGQLAGIEARPEPVVIEDDPETLSEYQIEKLLYLLKRDFIGYERIDPIKHDINVEDISCDGYNSPVFVYHTDYEQIISNIYHGEDELDDFVVKLAQRSGKGISKRRPQVDATLPDGSRAQLTLGREVSDHGTNYTIRQFKDVPFTPIDLVNWKTFSLEEMAFLWLCIENHKSLIFAGGTASGKTTSLNAVSLFIPSNTKIVSIEDTREVELPQRNWIASVTRPSFSDDAQGDVDEFDLLEAALRQRPDYIVMGEIRGEEGRTLFQVMSTGHTTYTTFHADSVGEVLKRFTTDPINVSKTMFTALDLVSIQTQTRVHGHKVRRNKELTEVNHYDAENDEINVQDVYQWQAETDEFLKLGDSSTLEEIKFDRGWDQERLDRELFKRKVILAYLIKNGLNEYREVAATIQAFINDPDTILTLIANGQLEDSLEDLREMESVLIDVDPAKEELVPRPDPGDEELNLATSIIEEADQTLFEDYRGKTAEGVESALGGSAARQTAPGGDVGGLDGDTLEDDFTFGADSSPFDVGGGASADAGSEAGGDDAGGDWFDGDEPTDDMWAEARAALEGEGDEPVDELPAGDDDVDVDLNVDPDDLTDEEGPGELEGDSPPELASGSDDAGADPSDAADADATTQDGDDGAASDDGAAATADAGADAGGPFADAVDGDAADGDSADGEDPAGDDAGPFASAAEGDAASAGDDGSAGEADTTPVEADEDHASAGEAADGSSGDADEGSDADESGPSGTSSGSGPFEATSEGSSADADATSDDAGDDSDDAADDPTDAGSGFGDAGAEAADTGSDPTDASAGFGDAGVEPDDDEAGGAPAEESVAGAGDDPPGGADDGSAAGTADRPVTGADDGSSDGAGADDSPFGESGGPFGEDADDDEPFWSDDDGDGPFSEGGPFSDDGPFTNGEDEDDDE